jgi:hypothetical protein
MNDLILIKQFGPGFEIPYLQELWLVKLLFAPMISRSPTFLKT